MHKMHGLGEVRRPALTRAATRMWEGPSAEAKIGGGVEREVQGIGL